METKKAAFFRLLGGLGEQRPYASFKSIRNSARKAWPDLKDDTLRHYLSEAASSEVLHDAGRGWYSSLAKPAILSAEPVQPWIDLVTAEFPLLEFTCWSTVHWNPWLRHLVNRPTVFIHVDTFNLPPVHDFLVTKGIDSRRNPTAAEIAKNPLGPNTVVLRPRLEAAPGEGPMASMEQFLVDSWVENKAFHLFDPNELQASALEWIKKERVQLAGFLRYLSSRKIAPAERFGDLSIIAK